MSDDEAKAEELLQQSKEQSRKDTEPTTDDTDDRPELEEAIRQACHDIDDGKIPENLTIRDENLAALFAGLERTGRLADVGYDAAAILDRDPEGVTSRAAVLRLLVRIGLSEINESLLESGKEGLDRYKSDQQDDF